MNNKLKIVIAYDGSASASDALADLPRAGLPTEAEVLVVSVSEIWMLEQPSEVDYDSGANEIVTMTPWRIHAENAVNDARKIARIAARRISERFPAWDVKTRVYANDPVLGVLTAAGEMNPDLIIVGSHGHNPLRRLVLGSVSQRVLAEAPGSVRIARHPSSVDGSPVRIIIGVDGTPDSNAAVHEVASRTWPARSTVRVIAIHTPPAEVLVPPLGPYVSMPIHATINKQREMLEKAAEEAARLVRTTGMPTTAEVIEGTPKSVLLDNAREWGADSIFLGAQGHRFLDRVLLGSVSAAVAAQAECSVEIVRMR